MILYKNYIRYNIFSDIINVISDTTSYGLNTVIELDGKYHYIGNKEPNIFSVIDFYQNHYNVILDQEEISYILEENNIK